MWFYKLRTFENGKKTSANRHLLGYLHSTHEGPYTYINKVTWGMSIVILMDDAAGCKIGTCCGGYKSFWNQRWHMWARYVYCKILGGSHRPKIKTTCLREGNSKYKLLVLQLAVVEWLVTRSNKGSKSYRNESLCFFHKIFLWPFLRKTITSTWEQKRVYIQILNKLNRPTVNNWIILLLYESVLEK